MKWREWLEDWSMVSLKISVPYLEMEWAPKDEDRDAAWELYIELLTRITTQPLSQGHGDEGTALTSVCALRPDTRHDQAARAAVSGIHQAGHRRS